MQKRQNDLGNDSVGKLVLRLALPAMVAQFVSLLYGVVDRIYIGNIPVIGATALAGVGVCAPITTLIGSFSSLIGLGGSPLAAIRMGEGRVDAAKKILANCTAALLVLSVVLTAGTLPFAKQLLLLFGASESTIPYAVPYLTIYVSGTVFALLSLGLNYFIICQGYSGIGMSTVLIGAVLNIVLDPVFIFGFGMGVSGAAVATVISQIASTVFVLLFLFSKRPTVRITFHGYSMRLIGRVLALGFSPFLIIATDSLLLILLNTVLQYYGGPQQGDLLVTACTIIQSFMQLVAMPLGGITGGTQPILSYNYGACKFDRIKKAEKSIVLVSLGFTTFMFVIANLFSTWFASIFTGDAACIEMASKGIRVITMMIIPLSFQYAFVDGLTALGIAKYAISLSLFRKTTYLICTVVYPIFWGATAAFYAEPTCDLISSIVSTTVFCLGFNQIMQRRKEMMARGVSEYSKA